MSRRHLLWIPALVLTTVAFGQPQQKATAKMINTAGATIGTATIMPTTRGTGVTINVTLKGLPAGTHGFHIHTVGKCDPPDFMSAGGHFNPESKQHGMENPQGHHAGDLANVELLGRGDDQISQAIGGVDLGTGPNGLFHAGGTALVIHANADDNKTDPSGNAGPRIACGVIEKAGS